jgi:hypothetical protein
MLALRTSTNAMEWRIIDAIGPFFTTVEHRRLNWSKIPFGLLEREGKLVPDDQAQITDAFESFIQRAADEGFNTITLDDLAHLLPDPDYESSLNEKIETYRAWYSDLASRAAARGLRTLITTDFMFYNDALHKKIGRSHRRAAAYIAQALDTFFLEFPDVAGVVLRIGESDGVDVKGDFHSELTLRTPRQAREMLTRLLPVFERHQRTLIFRTWSVGAYRIGDLMWNRKTSALTFDGLNSPALIVSHKYGESDFFRYLPLNKQFFRGDYPKIIELQARREYEGFGEYPSFIGWDYERYARQLKGRAKLAGFSVWCQTGGWSAFRRLTYLPSSSFWNELNAFMCMALFEHRQSVEEAVTAYCAQHAPHVPPDRFLTFLRLSDEVIKELLYLDEFSQRKLFFRRVRVPPLLWVFWDNIIINHSMRKMLRCFVSDGEAKIHQGNMALMKLREMMAMAKEWGLPLEDLQFQYDTFEILAAARVYYFRKISHRSIIQLKALTRRYRRKYPDRYVIVLNFSKMKLNRRSLKRVLHVCLRDERGYRFLDQVFTIRVLSLLFPLIRLFSRNRLPDFAEHQAMGIKTLFR